MAPERQKSFDWKTGRRVTGDESENETMMVHGDGPVQESTKQRKNRNEGDRSEASVIGTQDAKRKKRARGSFL